MRAVPLSLRQANALVAALHRHHKPVRGHRFSIGAVKDGKLVGAAIIGRPVARMVSQWEVAEVTRLVTDGTKNAASFLYGAAARIAKEMGFVKIQTYILDTEPGITLRASGWLEEVVRDKGRQWKDRPLKYSGGGPRRTDQPTVDKRRWVKPLNEAAVYV